MVTSTQESVDGKVLKALMDPRWQFMTVNGISEELGISQGETEAAIARNRLQIHEVGARDSNGNSLYYHAAKPRGKLNALLYELKVYLYPKID